MFYYLEGNVAVIEQNAAVIDVNGAGFFCRVTANTMSHLEIGKRARLLTYCSIREDAFDIFGFHDAREKRCFELLLSVSGVGPKAALSILSSVSPENMALAIVTDNEKALTAAPGIGKRIAQRIILELKDKVASESLAPAPAEGMRLPPTDAGSTATAAEEALLVLGYSRVEIANAMRKLDISAMSVEEIIREVLRGSIK